MTNTCMICVISCLADHPPKDLPSAPRRAPSAGRRELPRSLDRRRSRWWSRNADAGLETASPLLFQLVTRALLVRQALLKRRIQAQPVAHFRCRTAAGFDVEGGDLVGDGQQQ